MKYIFILVGLLFTFSLIGQGDENVVSSELKGKRYYNSIAFDFNMGSNPATTKGEFGYLTGFGLRYSAGFKMNRWLNFGAGLGFGFFNFETNTSTCGTAGCTYYESSNSLFIPLYAEARGELADWKVRPFYQLELGMGFRVKNEHNFNENRPKGVYFRPQIGWKFKGENDFSPSVAFGYLLQTSKEGVGYRLGRDVHVMYEKRKYQRYFIQFGFEF